MIRERNVALSINVPLLPKPWYLTRMSDPNVFLMNS
jgi:hypothetical protein